MEEELKKHLSEHVTLEEKEKKEKNQKKEEKPIPFQLKIAREAIAEHKFLENLKNKFKLKWDTEAKIIIKEKLEKRKKLNLHNGNDWKIKFYESKLDLKDLAIKKIKALIH